MQGLRPMFLPGAVVLRSKLRPAGTGKKQPSFLRLATARKTCKTADAAKFIPWEKVELVAG